MLRQGAGKATPPASVYGEQRAEHSLVHSLDVSNIAFLSLGPSITCKGNLNLGKAYQLQADEVC